jgi:molybdate transport system regulatory protein
MRKANALTENPAAPEMRIQVRIELGAGHRIGPGKVDLLEAIGEMGSITAAGRRLGMSYRRAWLLVSALNQMFDEAVVETIAGGAHGGGARLTPFGGKLVSAYRTLEKATGDAANQQLAPFRTKLALPQG